MGHNRNFDEMSREELCQIIGYDVDPTTSRDELVAMAIEKDEQA